MSEENRYDGGSTVQMEMPKYACHKEVWALKIGDIKPCRERNNDDMCEADNSAVIWFVDSRYAPIRKDHQFMHKHAPKIGGYLVTYKDGYQSFSPAEAFEDGYTLIED